MVLPGPIRTGLAVGDLFPAGEVLFEVFEVVHEDARQCLVNQELRQPTLKVHTEIGK